MKRPLPLWLCLVGPFGTIHLRPVRSALPPQSLVDHYRAGGLYRDVFIVHAGSLRRASRKARRYTGKRKSF